MTWHQQQCRGIFVSLQDHLMLLQLQTEKIQVLPRMNCKDAIQVQSHGTISINTSVVSDLSR
jgi:hypothetical protein